MARGDSQRNWSTIREIPLAERSARGFGRDLPMVATEREARQHLSQINKTLKTVNSTNGGDARRQRLISAANQIQRQLDDETRQGRVTLNGELQDILVNDA